MEMIELAQSRVNSDEFYDYDGAGYSQDPSGLEGLFLEATVKNKPLILRRYIPHPGGLGEKPETQTIHGFLQHQIRNMNPPAYCQILGQNPCEIENVDVLKEFETPFHERQRILNILGYPYVHHPTLSQNITPIKVLEDNDLLRRVACNGNDFDGQRMNPWVAGDCGFIVVSMQDSFTTFHMDVLSTAVMNSVEANYGFYFQY
jgi:hypothetical protein